MEGNPIVQWVEKKIGDETNFLRLDIGTPAAKEVMRKFKIPLNSAYLIFDQQGNEIWRSYAMPLNGKKAVRIINEISNSSKINS